jgi:hypothetical protein
LNGFTVHLYGGTLLQDTSPFVLALVIDKFFHLLDFILIDTHFLPSFHQDYQLVVDKDDIWLDLDVLDLEDAVDVDVMHRLRNVVPCFTE